jgi:hypothetical protein
MPNIAIGSMGVETSRHGTPPYHFIDLGHLSARLAHARLFGQPYHPFLQAPYPKDV